MTDLRERVQAIERAIADGEGDLSALAEGAATAERVTALEAEVDSLAEDVDELAAATQALRGYVGSVRSVNESVEERADAAMAAVESLEDRVADLEAVERSGPAVADPAVGAAAGDSGPNSRSRDQPTEGDRPGRPAGPAGDGGADRPGTRLDAESLDGFDPDEGGARVRVRQAGGGGRTTTDATDGGSDGDVVELVRNLL